MIKDKKEHSMTFRLTDNEYNYLSKMAFQLGTNPSQLVRQMINISINQMILAEKQQNERRQQEQQDINKIEQMKKNHIEV